MHDTYHVRSFSALTSAALGCPSSCFNRGAIRASDQIRRNSSAALNGIAPCRHAHRRAAPFGVEISVNLEVVGLNPPLAPNFKPLETALGDFAVALSKERCAVKNFLLNKSIPWGIRPFVITS